MSEQSSAHAPTIGDVCWLEIPATDLARCQTFYKTAFGWEFTAAPNMPDSDYAFFSKPNTKLAGGVFVVKEEDLVKPKISSDGSQQVSNRIIMAVEEVGAALKVIEAAGGETIKVKTEIGNDKGYFGSFRDTEGNINGVWSFK